MMAATQFRAAAPPTHNQRLSYEASRLDTQSHRRVNSETSGHAIGDSRTHGAGDYGHDGNRNDNLHFNFSRLASSLPIIRPSHQNISRLTRRPVLFAVCRTGALS